MALPKKLKMMNLFNEGNSYLGQTGEVTIPKLVRKLEDWRGGGMNGNVKIDLGLGDDITEFNWKLGGIDDLIIEQWGAATVSANMLRFAGSYQRDDTGETTAVEIVVRGRHEEIDGGDSEPGEDTEHKVVTNCAYYKLTVNGKVEIEIDVLGFKEVVDGKDRLEAQRKAIGL